LTISLELFPFLLYKSTATNVYCEMSWRYLIVIYQQNEWLLVIQVQYVSYTFHTKNISSLLNELYISVSVSNGFRNDQNHIIHAIV